jgi:hypothetical protein
VVRPRPGRINRAPILNVRHIVNRRGRQMNDPRRAESVIEVLVPLVTKIGAVKDGGFPRLELRHAGVAPEPHLRVLRRD